MKMYKVLKSDGRCVNGGSGKWKLPRGGRPGKWMPKTDKPILCERGYHLVPAREILQWYRVGYVVWEAEGIGEEAASSEKTAYAQARIVSRVGKIDERTMRLYACDCAERVLPIFEAAYPRDKRPRLAIEAARGYAHGTVTAAATAAAGDAARDAAGAAAGAAAWDAAGAAAWAAAWDAAGDAAGAAARAAARAAAWDAAGAAAGDAAGDAERRWQGQRLLRYLHQEAK